MIISFNKRLDPESSGVIVLDEHEGQWGEIQPAESHVDGNRLRLRFPRLPERRPFQIELRQVKDTPSLWHVKGKRPNETPPGTRILVK
ncbi:hypothetical protein CM49_04949 [Paenibacillus sp. P1XP2]|nr:hypothetical protein CM49_04949 [Paenibacillus sp. P1XP2]